MKKSLFAFIVLSIVLLNNAMAQRKVLVEQFTNSGCPNCAGNTPVVAAYVNDHPDEVLMLSYHAPFPYNDSMYFENAYQSDQRIDYYGVFGVPTSRVDGNYFSGNLVPVLATTITNRSAIAPRYSISFNSSTIVNQTVTANISFTSIDAANSGQSLKAMVVVAEKNVLKSSYAASPGNNSETQYPWVVRKMLPDDAGTDLQHTELNGSEDFILTWNADNLKDLNQMRIIAFVQNMATKEVYQAEISTPQISTGNNAPLTEANQSFELFPSITDSHFRVQFTSPQQDRHIKVLDVNGRVVYELQTSENLLSVDLHTLPAGMYFVQASNAKFYATKKLMVIN